MGCNCGDNEYNITVNNNGNCEPTIPIYNITLGNVGINGYSPIVRFVNETVESFNIAVDNITGTETSPAVPKLSYVVDQINSVNDTIADLGSTYLTINGSNAASTLNLNHLRLITNDNTRQSVMTNNGSPLRISGQGLILDGYAQSAQSRANSITIASAGSSITIGNTHESRHNIIVDNNGAFYDGNEIATLNDIPTVGNGTITFTQGGVTKGTFTTNQSGNTTIDLDAGGAITNPLVIKNADESREIRLGINTSTNKAEMSYALIGSGSTWAFPIKLIGNVSNPLVLTDLGYGTNSLTLNYNTDTMSLDSSNKLTVKEMTGCDSITGGTSGLVPAPSAGDENKFLKADGTWDTIGGGGGVTNPIELSETIVDAISNTSTTGKLTLGVDKTGSFPYPIFKIDYTETDEHGNTSTWTNYLRDVTKPAFKSGIIQTTSITNGYRERELSLDLNSNTMEIDSSGKITVKGMVGADSISGGSAGLVPAPSTGDQNKFLKGDGTWDTVSGGTVDQTFNPTSTHAQSGKAVAEAISTKQDLLTSDNAGTDIEIVNGAGGDKTVSGNGSVELEDAVDDGLNSVTLTGRCEQTATPSPSTPVDITTNNGNITVSPNLFRTLGTTTTQGGVTFTPQADGSVICSGRATGYYSYYLGRADFDPSTIDKITVAINGTFNASGNIVVDKFHLYSGSTSLGTISYTTWTQSVTVDIANDYPTADNIRVYLKRNSNTDTNATIRPMAVKGTVNKAWKPYKEVTTTGTVETVTDEDGNTATAEMLLSIGDYTDTQEILTGAVTRKVGVIVLDGTEEWGLYATNNGYRSFRVNNFLTADTRDGICTHLPYYNFYSSAMDRECIAIGGNKTTLYINLAGEERTVDDMKAWLASQYNAGTPVIIVYPLATETTETVTGQILTTVQGDSTLTITQASIDNLPIEANYNVQGGTVINFTGTIPTVNNATITITQGGVTKGSFTTNQSGNATIALDAGGGTPSNMVTTNTAQTITGIKTFGSNAYIQSDQFRSVNDDLIFYTGNSNYCYMGYYGRELRLDGSSTRPKYSTDGSTYTEIALYSDIPTVPTNISAFTNDSGYITNSALSGYALTSDIPTATSDLTNDSGYITGITSTDVTTALGYTPVNKAGDTMTGGLILSTDDTDNSSININNVSSTQRDITFNAATHRTAVIRSVVNSSNQCQLLLGVSNTNNDAPNGIRIVRDTSGTAYIDQFPQCNAIDGQWVKSEITAFSERALNDSSTALDVDLSTYLPNDNYAYEVLVRGIVTTGSSSGNYIILQAYTSLTESLRIAQAQTRTSSTITGAGAAIIPVGGNNRTFKVIRNTGYNGNATLTFTAYRRLGTNI